MANGMYDQAKMAMKLKKMQNDLAKEIVEVEAGDGAVVVRVACDMKLKKVSIDPDKVDFDDVSELEKWIELAIREAMNRAQQTAAEKMKPLMGGLGNLGL